MTTKGTQEVESFDLLAESEGDDAAEIDTEARRAHVLESIEQSDQLRDRPVLILCPGCNTEVERYENGLPSYLSWFKSHCEECEVELRRWSVVAVDAAYRDTVTTSDLETLVQQYWDQHLWEGIVTAENCPRTREYTREYSTRATEYGWDWELSCPLCRRTLDELGITRLDYHHWSRDPDQGICLCRDCHNAINGGDLDIDVDWKARTLGLRNKHDYQIIRLAVRDHQFKPAKSVEELVTRLVDRYNLIQEPEVVRTIIKQATQSDELQSLLENNLSHATH